VKKMREHAHRLRRIQHLALMFMHRSAAFSGPMSVKSYLKRTSVENVHGAMGWTLTLVSG
jgi:hypothetical protein